MKKIFLYLVSFCMTLSVTAQESVRVDSDRQPLFMVDSFKVDIKHLVIDSNKIESVNILKDSKAIAMYGNKAKYGVVIIKTKPNTRLLRINDILTEYKVPTEQQKLRICIDNTLMSKPDLILVEKSEIIGVRITSDRKWINADESDSNEKFINIQTRQADKNGL